jgi:FkbM family methyltransferase
MIYNRRLSDIIPVEAPKMFFREKHLKIILKSHPKGLLTLGESIEIHLSLRSKAIEYRLFIEQQDTIYLQPFRDWSREPVVHYYPETPGNYKIRVQWRDSAKTTQGVKILPFKVLIYDKSMELAAGPESVSIEPGVVLQVPSKWEAAQMVGYEEKTKKRIEEIIRPGWVAYDIGANVGYYSILMSKYVGEQGRVICVEANPVNVYFLRNNLKANAITNATVIPVALSDRPGELAFLINYGNLTIGLTQDSYLFASKVGHQIQAQSASLDDILSDFALPAPNCIKIDIEGGEAAALAGMAQTLQNHRPTLILEIHGIYLVEKCIQLLDPLGYTYSHPETGMKFSNVREILDWYPGKVQIFICEPL